MLAGHISFFLSCIASGDSSPAVDTYETKRTACFQLEYCKIATKKMLVSVGLHLELRSVGDCARSAAF